MLEKFKIPDINNSDDWQHRLISNLSPSERKSEEASLRIQAAENVRRSVAGLSEIIHNEGFQRGQLLRRWYAILGENIGANASPRYIKNKTLHVVCSSPIWSQEISLQQSVILKRFNACLAPEHQLKKIVCKVGDITLPQRIKPQSVHLPQTELTEAEQLRVKQIQTESSDPEFSALLAKVYAQNLLHNRQMQALGAIKCTQCHHLSFTGSPCIECRRQEKEQERLQILKILDKQPWSKYSDIKQAFQELEISDFMRYRLALASSWRENIRQYMESLAEGTEMPEELQVRMIKLIALEMSKPYAEITEGDVKSALALRTRNGKIYSYAYGQSLLSKTIILKSNKNNKT
ncbi:MAG: DUF721 domain-containing protein [bacterium]|nr:DUF721 domain-containing protein [bacterium]